MLEAPSTTSKLPDTTAVDAAAEHPVSAVSLQPHRRRTSRRVTRALFQVGQPGIWRKQLPGGPEEKIADVGQAMQWALTDEGPCYVKGPRSGQGYVECVDVASRAVTWSAPLQGPAHLWGSLSISPDRRWLLMDRRDRQDGDLMVAQNFE